MLDELFAGADTAPRYAQAPDGALWEGRIVAVERDEREVEVAIPALDADGSFGPYPYTPHPGADGPVHPKADDRALVAFPEVGDGWVLQWR